MRGDYFKDIRWKFFMGNVLVFVGVRRVGKIMLVC